MKSSARFDFILMFAESKAQNELVSEIQRRRKIATKRIGIKLKVSVETVDYRLQTLNMRIAYDEATAKNAMPNRMFFVFFFVFPKN